MIVRFMSLLLRKHAHCVKKKKSTKIKTENVFQFLLILLECSKYHDQTLTLNVFFFTYDVSNSHHKKSILHENVFTCTTTYGHDV